MNVTSLYASAFAGCTALEAISVAEGNRRYDSRENCNAIIETDTNTLVTGCKETIIPESVVRIGKEAFRGQRLNNLFIIETISDIDGMAFADCAALETINVAKGNRRYDSRENCNAIIETNTNKLILGCKSTTFPNSVSVIDYAAFWGCLDLTEIIIPKTITDIGFSAFEGCVGLSRVEIPNTISRINPSVFQGCCNLKAIFIPESVNEIREYAFLRCSNLERIEVAKDNKVYDSRNNCNAIIQTSKNILIQGCSNTVIPESVTEIGWNAFYGCRGLRNIVIPHSITRIGDNAFTNCINLMNVVIPESVNEIGGRAFEGCQNLKSIVIPKSVNEIGYDAIPYGCKVIRR